MYDLGFKYYNIAFKCERVVINCVKFELLDDIQSAYRPIASRIHQRHSSHCSSSLLHTLYSRFHLLEQVKAFQQFSSHIFVK